MHKSLFQGFMCQTEEFPPHTLTGGEKDPRGRSYMVSIELHPPNGQPAIAVRQTYYFEADVLETATIGRMTTDPKLVHELTFEEQNEVNNVLATILVLHRMKRSSYIATKFQEAPPKKKAKKRAT